MDPISVGGLIVAILFGGISWYYSHRSLRVSQAAAPVPKSAEGASISSASSGLDLVEARYRRHIVDTYQFLDFRGIVQLEKIPIRLPLEALFVSLRARPLSYADEQDADHVAGRPFRVMDLAESIREKMALRGASSQSGSIVELLERCPGAVLLGDPGSGKSTVLKHLALTAARAGTGQPGAPLPIILPVAAYAAALAKSGDLSVQQYLAAYYHTVRGVTDDLGDLFASALAAGRVVILLDGLDEVADVSNRVFVSKRVQDFYNWHKGQGNRFVVTSRIVGYDEAPLAAEGLAHFVLLDFSKGEIETFVTNWCSTFETASRGENTIARQAADDERTKLTSAIFSNASVKRLAANPLLLTILALIHRQGTELPRRRVELYELYIKTLIGSWSRARNLDGRPIGAMDDVEAVKLLAPLAYWMHAEKPAGTARENELLARVTAYYSSKRAMQPDDADREARHFLNDIRRYAGLLTERGDKAYGFVHLTFEEYLAGREIIFQGQVDKQRSVDLIGKHLLDPAWREVILLAVGYASIVAKEEETAALLIAGLTRDGAKPNSAGVNVLVAGECLRDIGIEGAGRAIWDSVRGRLARLLGDRSIPVQSRWRAGELLGFLEDPRFTNNEDVPETISIAGGRFLMGTEPAIIQSLAEQIRTVALPDEAAWVRDYWIACLRSEEPQHECVVDSFAIGRYPVTNAQYQRFIAASPDCPVPLAPNDRAQPYAWDQKLRTYPPGRSNFPVVLVSWDEATRYQSLQKYLLFCSSWCSVYLCQGKQQR
jgi:hypothetical protein